MTVIKKYPPKILYVFYSSQHIMPFVALTEDAMNYRIQTLKEQWERSNFGTVEVQTYKYILDDTSETKS